MQLNTIKPAEGSKKSRRRVGRGIGSGLGKTAGRGHKGQKSRAGGFHKVGFEGGQMPLHRRMPKRGFNNIFRTEYVVVNLDAIADRFEAGALVSPDTLRQVGLVSDRRGLIKVLGRGDVGKQLTVQAHKFSGKAAEKIAAAGGTAEVLGASAVQG